MSDAGEVIIESYMCFIECPDCWCTINELGESWEVKIDLIEESYFQVIELRGVDEGHEVLYIFDNPFETKTMESGDDRTF